MAEGAAVVLADIDEKALGETTATFAKAYGKDNIRGVAMDVIDTLEVIDIQKQQSQLTIVTVRDVQGRFQSITENRAVG
ncbi:MAG: hypothetical protein ACTS5I_12300 [Rhodanobacter sp.]